VERSDYCVEQSDYCVERSDYCVEQSDLEQSDHGAKDRNSVGTLSLPTEGVH